MLIDEKFSERPFKKDQNLPPDRALVVSEPSGKTNAIAAWGGDHAALEVATSGNAGLCTIVNIEGSFSRRLGAQLAVTRTGQIIGSLADGCLEKQLAKDIAECSEPCIKRYGAGSAQIDFRLPCGGGLDILLDPFPNVKACADAVAQLSERIPAALVLPPNPLLAARKYLPALRVVIYGVEPETSALTGLLGACGIETMVVRTDTLALGQEPNLEVPDAWTAVILLFHDHEWETAILRHALRGSAFYIGAQGGKNARDDRLARLLELGIPHQDVERVRGPIGITPSSRTPAALALSILAEVVWEYERLHPHG